ncbi:hypothetical protein BKA66DRAFT_445151 [Pyrenochaeta sp. MPI-SDFR-AT-0127]|nr:hypothetical protein BKA66DRAFT_445151 [Pyrenochaeta sp. MPI-SDFR-AT-0127]
MGPATGTEKRGRVTKSRLKSKQSTTKSRATMTEPHATAKKHTTPIRSGTHLGTARNIPILLSSDEEDNIANDEELEEVPYVSDIHVPAGFVLGRSIPAPCLESPLREAHNKRAKIVKNTFRTKQRATKVDCWREKPVKRPLHSYGPTPPTNVGAKYGHPNTTRDAEISRLRLHSGAHTSGLHEQHSRSLRPSIAALARNESMKLKLASPNSIHTNIDHEVAILLHNDPRCHVTQKRVDLDAKPVRQSTTSCLSIRDNESDEIMVKIDPSDSFAEWDTSELPPEPTRKQKRPRRPRTDPFFQKTVNSAATLSKRTANVHRSSAGAKKKPKVGISRTRIRENSIDRDFIVPDNVIYMASDYSSPRSQSSNETEKINSLCGPAMVDSEDDGCNLHIDMQPKYAFNTELLRKKREMRS